MHVRLLVILAGAGLLPACFDLDTSREQAVRGTLGEEIHAILHKDLDRFHPEKGEAFRRERDRFVRAFDTVMPEGMLSDLQDYLVGILPVYDEQLLPGVLRPAACILSELGREASLLEAIWYLAHPEGYGDTQCPLTRRVLVHADIDALFVHLAELWLAHDGLDEDLVPDSEDDTFAALLRELTGEMQAADYPTTPEETTAEALVGLLLRNDARLLESDLDENWVVHTDARGRALVAADPLTGEIPAPFCDSDTDGFADIDPASGDFRDCSGLPLSVPPPFDPDGSRNLYDGKYVYRYSDLRQSNLAALVEQLPPLVDDGFLWDLPDALPALLGPPVARADEQGVFPGHDPDDSPAVALVHAGVSVLRYERLPELLEALMTVLELHEHQVARLLHEFDRVSGIMDRHPDTSLAPRNRLVDDLYGHLVEMAERGYLLVMMRAFADSRAMDAQQGMADMIRYRDILSDEDMVFRVPTDFSLPDTEYQNRSNQQKMFHLTHDTNGKEHATELLGTFEAFVIEDMLGFWLDSTSRMAEVPFYINWVVTEFSSTNPTTEEVNRFMVHDHYILDIFAPPANPVGHEGHELRLFNAESLLALELSGNLRGLRPIIESIVVLDRNLPRTGTQVLADLLAAIHPHYSVNIPPHVSPACANIRPLEPMLLEIMDDTDLLRALTELIGALRDRRTESGLDVLEEIDLFARHALAWDGSLKRHDGAASVLAVDETTRLSPFSRFYLLLDALRTVDDAVEGDPAADAALERTAELLSDRFLEVEEVAGVWRFKNRRAWFVVLNLLEFLQEQAAWHKARGTLLTRLDELEEDVREAVGGRVMPRIVGALDLISSHPTLPAEMDALVLDLLDPDDTELRAELRKNAAWLLQTLTVDRWRVPAARFAGRHLSPDAPAWRVQPGAGCVSSEEATHLVSRLMQLTLTMATTEVDGRDVFAELIANLGQRYPGTDDFPLADFGEVIEAIQRADPRTTGEHSVEDLGKIFFEVSDYLLDDRRGIEKLYEMVERRNGF